MPTDDRPHDIVVLGATGFTGALTASYLAGHLPKTARWALAGRNMAKLERVREQLGEEHSRLELLKADVTDAKSLADLARSARVVVTTVGPYTHYGEPLVKACAEHGADYVDITGEPEFVDRMYVAHHRRAGETGARIVHACGFDSIPHDLGTQFTVEQLPRDTRLVVKGHVQAGGRPSGGTYQSALTAFSRARQMQAAHAERKRAEERFGERRPTMGRRVQGISFAPPRRVKELGGAFAVPLPTLDPQVVLHSAKQLDTYGPDFTYGHFAAIKSPVTLVGGAVGVSALFALTQLPPTRDLLLKRMKSGDGPTPEQRAKAWFKVTFVGEAPDAGERVVCTVSGGDPGYDETAKMLGEAAMCLAFDGGKLPDSAGCVTTAVAMGPVLRERLVAAGMPFRKVG